MTKERRGCRDEANSLLPWYFNGSLEGAEEERVRAHLESCSVCSQELLELAELAELTRRAASHPPGGELSPGPVPRRSPLRSPRAVAAVLGAAALLAVVLARETLLRRGNPPPQTQEVRLDLGSGLLRGTSSLPRFTLTGTETRVTISFMAPVAPGASYEIEIRDAAGAPLAHRDRGPLDLDAMGRARFVLSAPSLSRPGDYYLVLREFAEGAEAREYSYPFLIERPASR